MAKICILKSQYFRETEGPIEATFAARILSDQFYCVLLEAVLLRCRWVIMLTCNKETEIYDKFITKEFVQVHLTGP